MFKRAEGPLVIKAMNAFGKAGKQKRKWSETMELAGSKHLMECPAGCANNLFQIERNSGRLNRATWNICSRSSSQLLIGKAKQIHCLVHRELLLLICNQFGGLSYSRAPYGVEGMVMFCASAPHRNKSNKCAFQKFLQCVWKILIFLQCMGSGCRQAERCVILPYLPQRRGMMQFECPSWYLDMIINNPSVG